MKLAVLFIIFMVWFPAGLLAIDLTNGDSPKADMVWTSGSVILGVDPDDTTKVRPIVAGKDGCMWSNCYENEVAADEIYSVKSDTKFGHGTVGTAFEAVWDYAVTADNYPFLTTETTLYLSSSSTADDLGSTGGITVEITGLDVNYDFLIETITLDGQTTVETTGQFWRVFRAKVTGVGSGGVNAGDIYIHRASNLTNGVPDASDKALVYAKIQASAGQTLMCVYTVPNGYKMLVHGVAYSLGESAKAGTVRLYTRTSGSSWQVKLQDQIFENGLDSDFNYPMVFPEKTDILVQGKAGTGTLVLGAHLHYTIHRTE